MEQGTFDLADEPPAAPVRLCECGCGQPAPIATVTRKRGNQVKGQPLRFVRGHRNGREGPQLVRRKLSVETDQRIGRSVVIDPEVGIPEPGTRRMTRGARLRCDCGTEYVRRLTGLLKAPDPSCGCMKGLIDRTGERFGKLTAIRRVEGKPSKAGGTTRWLCRCDCGGETVADGRDLRRGHTKSCGCMKRGRGQDYARGEAAFNKTLRSYQQNAQTRGHSWEVTGEEFNRLAAMDCHYCGTPPSMITKGSLRGGDYVYNGLDRIDNSLGYTLGNVLTCCKICNHAKVDMPYDDFLAWIAQLVEYHFFHPEVMPSRLLIPHEPRAR